MTKANEIKFTFIGLLADLMAIFTGKNALLTITGTIVKNASKAEDISNKIYYLIIIIVSIIVSIFIFKNFIYFFEILFKKLKYVKNLSISELKFAQDLKNDGIKSIYLNTSSESKRLISYEELRKNAKHDIFLIGIGNTNFSQNREFIDNLLKQDKSIRILMQSPQIFENVNFEKIFGKRYLSEYFARKKYEEEIIASYNRLKEICREYRERGYTKKQIEMREYRSIYSLNMTARDINFPDGELIIEFCYPMITDRVRLHICKNENNEMYVKCINSMEKIYDKAIITI